MNETLAPDLCVIGGGSAGLSVAAAAAAFGVSVVLIERDRMGGDCLNFGCVPSKALIAAARRVVAVREAGRFGVSAAEPQADFAAVLGHVRRTIASIAPNDSAERFAALGVRVIRGAARFSDARTVQVGDISVRARRTIVAAGSRPFVPPIPNLDTIPFLTNETVFNLTRLPAQLIVLGAGPVGLELAQAFRRLGSEVTVLEADQALLRDDPELAALLVEDLRAERIEIFERAEIVRVARRGRSGVRVTWRLGEEVRTTDGSHLLVAAGRRADLAELGLEAAGVAFDESGVKVDAGMRTTNRRVYAIGDAAGGPQFTHWASYQAGLVVRAVLFRLRARVRPELLAWAIFTDPELAHVGLTEAEARARYGHVEILRWPFSENDRAQAERETRGSVKVLVTARGTVVGADILARHAGELIAPWVLAVSQKMNIRSIAVSTFPYPTLSESARRAALSFYAPRLGSRWIARTIRLLSRFG